MIVPQLVEGIFECVILVRPLQIRAKTTFRFLMFRTTDWYWFYLRLLVSNIVVPWFAIYQIYIY